MSRGLGHVWSLSCGGSFLFVEDPVCVLRRLSILEGESILDTLIYLSIYLCLVLTSVVIGFRDPSYIPHTRSSSVVYTVKYSDSGPYV